MEIVSVRAKSESKILFPINSRGWEITISRPQLSDYRVPGTEGDLYSTDRITVRHCARQVSTSSTYLGPGNEPKRRYFLLVISMLNISIEREKIHGD